MAKRAGVDVPARIQNAPDLLPGLNFYYQAFNRLTTSRMVASGCVGPIPYAAIAHFCDDNEIWDSMREDMLYHIEHLDRTYMEWQTKKAANELKQQQAQQGR